MYHQIYLSKLAPRIRPTAVLALFVFSQQVLTSQQHLSTSLLHRTMSSIPTTPFTNIRPKEDVWSYPRPPALQTTPLRLRVIYIDPQSNEEVVLADSKRAYRVLETTHPPTYYINPEDVKLEYLKKNDRKSFCEWKGIANYYDFNPPSSPSSPVRSRIWTYSSPTPSFTPIKDHLAFYVGPWRCFVEGEEVNAQDGDFYGGWKTGEIVGDMKGRRGTEGW